MHTTQIHGKLENEQLLDHRSIRDGQLLRIHWTRSYNRYVRSQRSCNLIATVIATVEDGTHWQLFVGGHYYGLMYRGPDANPQWCVYEESIGQKHFRTHDVHGVYGELTCH